MLFPEKTEFKKRIPKQKFYTNMEITSNLKKAFVEQIKIIYSQNKLTSTTLNSTGVQGLYCFRRRVP